MFSDANLHPCCTCNSLTTVYLCAGSLTSHQTKKHPTSCSHNNASILTEIFPDSDWSRFLPWLHAHKIQPPPFRHNLWHDTTQSDCILLFESYAKLLRAMELAKLPPDDDLAAEPAYESTTAPLWTLNLLFQSLVLCPFRENKKFSVSKCIRHRLHLLHSGNIIALYNHAFASSHTPSMTDHPRATTIDDFSPPDDSDDDTDISISNPAIRQVQKLVDDDSYHQAFACIRRDTPVAA